MSWTIDLCADQTDQKSKRYKQRDLWTTFFPVTIRIFWKNFLHQKIFCLSPNKKSLKSRFLHKFINFQWVLIGLRKFLYHLNGIQITFPLMPKCTWSKFQIWVNFPILIKKLMPTSVLLALSKKFLTTKIVTIFFKYLIIIVLYERYKS